jgi:hypothetical protein
MVNHGGARSFRKFAPVCHRQKLLGHNVPIVHVCHGLCWIGYRLMKETGVCRMEYLGEVRTATDPAFVQLSSTNDVALLVDRERETAERETGL